MTRHDDSTHGDWKGLKGRVSKKMLEDIKTPPPADDTLILACGPKQFNEYIKNVLENMEYTDG